MTALLIERVWAMPDPNTFDIPAIHQLVKWWAYRSDDPIDPFARNNRLAAYNNDLNPDTAADYHMDALEFLKMLVADGVQSELVLFDPPYSPRQVQEVYNQIGKTVTQEDTQLSGYLAKCKDEISKLVVPGGRVISCGWNSSGIGITLGFELERILLVCHGGGHNDTIVTVERKIEADPVLEGLFERLTEQNKMLPTTFTVDLAVEDIGRHMKGETD